MGRLGKHLKMDRLRCAEIHSNVQTTLSFPNAEQQEAGGDGEMVGGVSL